MAQIYTECEIFDPIRFTTKTRVKDFILDTWFEQGLISRSLYERLPGIEVQRSSKVYMSSGMYVNQPEVQIGLQINNLRALPITVNVVENGPANLLLGSDFLKLIFDIGIEVKDITLPHITFEPVEKYTSDSLALRIQSDRKNIDSLEFENFLSSIRRIHNIGVIATTKLHQHSDWNTKDQQIEAIRKTINNNQSLSSENYLQISYTGSGSIWLNLVSGSKKAFSWLSQLFSKSVDARLRSTIANAATAEEEAEIKKLSREEILNAKKWEQKRIAAENIRKAREEWQKTVLSEIDFRKKIKDNIEDPEIRKVITKELDKSITDLMNSKLLPIVENIPAISDDDKDNLPTKNKNLDDKET